MDAAYASTGLELGAGDDMSVRGVTFNFIDDDDDDHRATGLTTMTAATTTSTTAMTAAATAVNDNWGSSPSYVFLSSNMLTYA